MKRLASLLPLLTLVLLVGCRPTISGPKNPTPPPSAPPTATNGATESGTLSTATAGLTLAPAATNSTPSPAPAPVPSPTTSALVAPAPAPTATTSAAQQLPPPPLLGPGTGTSSTPTATTSTSGTVPTPPPVVVPVNPSRPTTLRVLAPEGQISDGIRQELATKLGAELQVETYATVEEAVQKLTATNATPVALALISYRAVPQLISAQALAPLPALSQTQRPAPKYLHHFFDRDNKYSLPYAFSVAAMAVRAADVKAPISQWNQLFHESMLKNAHFPADTAFVNTLKTRAGLRASGGDSVGDVGAADAPVQVDSVANLKKKFATQPGWRFVLPGEGSVIFLHCVVVPANSPAPDKSAALVAALFTPEVLARLAEENYLGVTQLATLKTLPPASTGDTLIYPPDRILDKCVFVRPGFRPIPSP